MHNNSGRSTTEQVLKQWKATILTDPGTIERQHLAAMGKEEEAIRAKEKRDAAAETKKLKEAGARRKCDGKVVLCCLKDELKMNVDSKLKGKGSSLCDWWVCPVRGCNAAFCSSCTAVIRAIHEQFHKKKA